jgi:hypothetical protein
VTERAQLLRRRDVPWQDDKALSYTIAEHTFSPDLKVLIPVKQDH